MQPQTVTDITDRMLSWVIENIIREFLRGLLAEILIVPPHPHPHPPQKKKERKKINKKLNILCWTIHRILWCHLLWISSH